MKIEIGMRSTGLGSLGELIFYDRYSAKDRASSLIKGQLVVVCPDKQSKTRQLAEVLEVGDLIKVRTLDLQVLELPLIEIDAPCELFEDSANRIARAVGSAEGSDEREDIRTVWQGLFYGLIASKKFVPAGRVWAGAGSAEQLTPYNCYVIAPPKDSRGGILEALSNMTEIMSRGGGVGIPLMTLRPHHALVRGVNGRSSGSVNWAEIYSFVTNLIEQGGSRRGALMLIQYCWHPDIFDFVTRKKTPSKLEGANVSVGITDPFMDAVLSDSDWQLKFPDTSHPAYDWEWDGDLELWESQGRPVIVYKTVKARELWDLIVKSAWDSAEPGLFFVDRYNKLSNSYYYKRGKIWCCNPCGEQGLPEWGVCNLGHLNLPKFLIGNGVGDEPAQVNWPALKDAVRTAVRFMDDLIDIAYAPLVQNTTQQRGERRIGLGTMGLGEMLIRLHIKYGRNDECLNFLDELYRTICETAYLTSTELAEEKGSFEWFDADKILESGFIRMLPEHVRDAIRTKGLRNVTLLTQAPTGTVGTMMNTSTGIEPYPWWVWVRNSRLGEHKEMASVYAEYLEAHPALASARDMLSMQEQAKTSTYMPEYFVCAASMSPEDHAYTQAAIQRWTDSSISKTSNLPAEYTPEQVGDYYRLLYSLGCKGGTVYRDRSRQKQVLDLPSETKTESTPVLTLQESVVGPELLPIPTDPYDLKAASLDTPAGKMSVKIGLDPVSKAPFETWIDLSRAGTALNGWTEALARMVSLMLRLKSPVSSERRLELVVEQLSRIGGGDSIGFGPRRVLSVPDAVSIALSKILSSIRKQPEVEDDSLVEPPPSLPAQHPHADVDLCPDCHGASLYRADGCTKCPCGYSRC